MGKASADVNNDIMEVRQIHEMGDFPKDVRQAAEGFDYFVTPAAAKA